MKYLYKYPQAAYPYSDLVETSRRRGRHDMEYELLDTGVFDQDRYFDVFVEYAKAAPLVGIGRLDSARARRLFVREGMSTGSTPTAAQRCKTRGEAV
jgi:hypothetical protein